MFKLNDEIIITQEIELHDAEMESYTLTKGSVGKVIRVEDRFFDIKFNGTEFSVSQRLLEQNAKVKGAPVLPTTRFSEVLTDNLNFAAAMNQLFSGHKVARKVWGGYWKLGSIYTDGEFGAEYKRAIVAHLKDGGWSVATPYQDDMLAADWMVVR